MCLPSGLQRGWRFFFGVVVNCRRQPPWLDASQRLAEVLLPARSTVVTTYTTVLPSGLMRGSATRWKRKKSSSVIGRLPAASALDAETSSTVRKNNGQTTVHVMIIPFGSLDLLPLSLRGRGSSEGVGEG